jgi:cytochrome d ubiquinol oxidase subunit I
MARSTLKLGSITAIVAFLAVGFTGDMQATKMVEIQPMKMAAAEALYETSAPAPFSIFTVGTLDGSEPLFSVDIPHGLSLLATHSWDGEVQGINDLQAQYEQEFGPGDYRPNIPAAYWNFRLMIGFGALGALIAVWMLWATRGGRVPTTKWFPRLAMFAIILPLLGSSTGWIFTEMGRQPWIVFGQMFTAAGVSPTVSVFQVVTSMTVFTLLYGALAVIEVGLLMRAVKIGPPDTVVPNYPDKVGEDRPLTVTY